MKVIPFIYSEIFELASNAYLIIDSQNNCVVIDPGANDTKILNYIKNNKLNLKGILLTHGHFDHIAGVNILLKNFKTEVYVAEEDIRLLNNPHLNCSDRFSRKDVVVKEVPKVLEDWQELKLLEETIQVIKTPYHTEGSVCFYLKDSKVLFSGDSLFKGSVGRMDFVTSKPELFEQSLRIILSLPSDTLVYPGHEDTTTIGEEKKNYMM